MVKFEVLAVVGFLVGVVVEGFSSEVCKPNFFPNILPNLCRKTGFGQSHHLGKR